MKTKLTTFFIYVSMLFIVAQSVDAQKREKDFKIVAPFASFAHDVRKFTVIDTAKYVITYSVKVIINPVKYPTDTLNEVLKLQIGNRLSKSFNQTLFEADSILFYQYIAKGKNGPYKPQPLIPVEVYKNYPKGSSTVEYRLTKYNFRYKESYPNKFNWKLSNERKRMLGYTCQRATCTFRGRNYTAWFTSEIPTQNGPYKFGGLPGLIVQINDDKKEYVFTCIGISKPKSIVLIKKYNWDFKEITREKLNEYLIKVHNNQAQFFITSTNSRSYIGDKDVTAEMPNIFSYNPIELE